MAADYPLKPGTGPGWTSYEPDEHRVFAHMMHAQVEQFVKDCRGFAHVARGVKLDQLHTRFGLSWEDFCLQELWQPAEVVEAIIVGVEALGEEAPIPAEVAERVGRQVLSRREQVQQAAEQTTGEALPAHRPESNLSAQFAHLTQPARALQSGVGRRTQQKLDRLARDFPALHAAVIAGELSTHAAAKLAGIVKDPSPLTQLRRLWKKMSPDERAVFLDEILQV